MSGDPQNHFLCVTLKKQIFLIKIFKKEDELQRQKKNREYILLLLFVFLLGQ